MNTNIKLMVVLGKFNRVFIERLSKDLESLGMPASAYPILAHLNDVGRARTQKLGEIAVITSGSITHMVNKLEKNGFVRKSVDENDRRVYWVELTDEGQKKFTKAHKEHMKYLDKLLEDFTEDEKESFIDQIKRFGKTIERKEV